MTNNLETCLVVSKPFYDMGNTFDFLKKVKNINSIAAHIRTQNELVKFTLHMCAIDLSNCGFTGSFIYRSTHGPLRPDRNIFTLNKSVSEGMNPFIFDIVFF